MNYWLGTKLFHNKKTTVSDYIGESGEGGIEGI